MASCLSKVQDFLLKRVPNKDSELIRKMMLIYGIAITGIFFLVVLGIITVIQGKTFIGIMDLFMALLLAVLVINMHYTSHFLVSSYIGIFFIYLLFLYVFVTGGVNKTSYMWMYSFPLCSHFLLGARKGAIATLLLFIPSAIFLLLGLYNPEIQLYSAAFTLRFIPSFLIVFLFSFMFEKSRENAHEKLNHAIAHQEQVIEQRTEQLHKEIEKKEEYSRKLRHSQKMEAIGLMAGGVAHDLNNILSGVVSYPELIQRKLGEKSDLHKSLDIIKDSGKRAAAVVADLLTVARGVASEKSVCSVNSLIHDYLKSPEFEALASRYPTVRYVSRPDSEIMNIKCSPVHFRKCFMNIVVNAFEAIDREGTVSITTYNKVFDELSAQSHNLKAGNYIVVSVKDNGPGISNDDMEHIFEPFYTKKIMGRSGTGLGLAVAWNTMKDHDGAVTVESSINGSTFDLYFPATSETTKQHDQNAQQSRHKGRGETILIVDDEQLQIDITSRILSSLGYKTASALSGEEAVEYLKQNTADLVILDMIMGEGINGRKTYEEIIKLHPGQAAIIVSGYSKNKEVDLALNLGVKGFISKPYSITEMSRLVHEILEQKNIDGGQSSPSQD